MLVENVEICHCMQVSVADIDGVLHDSETFEEVEQVFEKVQMETQCATVCGGCHEKVMDVISELMHQ